MSIAKLFAGPDGPKQKMSTSEQLSNILRLEDDKQREKIFFPQEVHQLEDAFDPSTSAVRRGIISGRASNEAAKQELAGLQAARGRATASGANLGSGANLSAFNSANRDVTQGLQASGAATDFAVQNAHDNDMMNVVRTGRNMQGGIYNSLGDLADSETTRVQGKAAAKRVVQESKNKALSDIATTAITLGGSSYLDAKKTSGAGAIADDQLSPFGRYLRSAGVGS